MATPPPFGLILPSRPVQVEPQVISQTQFAFSFSAVPQFSHIVVFLLPGFTMPGGTLAGVYLQWPESAPEFSLLGAIGTDKQSAIFQVKGSRAGNSTNNVYQDDGKAMTDVGTSSAAAADAGTVTVGISIEPAAALSEQLQSLQATFMQQGGQVVSTKMLAQRIIKNAFNFLSSFAGSVGPGGQEVVPLKSFHDWWIKFERRVENDPGFLERDDA